MATKDFLSSGINSIRYKNGNLVNIASYSEMALRTAEKRATMYGDGEKRQEWDIDTVVVYGHNGACPLCSRWQNRIYIDDVYSNGKPNNKYPLLSVAIQGGLYHPNCKCPPPQTYIEDITDLPTQKTTPELKEDIQNYNLEQVQRYHERQIRKYKRLEANSLDENNRKKYAIKVQEWQSKQREFINAHPETLRRDYSREKVRVLNITEPPKNAIEVTPIVQNSLTSTQNSGNMKTGGKITENNAHRFEFFEKQATRYYNQQILNDEDIKKISKNTSFTENEILKIKNHLMREEHLFKNGEKRKFDVDIDIALAWQRLIKGENILESDIILLNHELTELLYMKEHNCPYEQAHAYAVQFYDWDKAINQFVDTDNLEF